MRQSGQWSGVVVTVAIATLLAGCGTLTGIPSHGGGKRFAIEQRLVSTTIRGALKQIDLSVLQDQTVFIQLTAVNDQGGGNIAGGRGNLLFGLQGITESSPITSQKNSFEVFDLSSAGNSITAQTTRGGNSTTNSSVAIVGTNSSNTSTTNGSSALTANTNSTSNTNSTDASTVNTSTTNTTANNQ